MADTTGGDRLFLRNCTCLGVFAGRPRGASGRRLYCNLCFPRASPPASLLQVSPFPRRAVRTSYPLRGGNCYVFGPESSRLTRFYEPGNHLCPVAVWREPVAWPAALWLALALVIMWTWSHWTTALSGPPSLPPLCHRYQRSTIVSPSSPRLALSANPFEPQPQQNERPLSVVARRSALGFPT